MKLNENEGLISALKLHNDALLERVQFLAARVESLTFESRHVERLRDEFYQHCTEYIDKKRQIGNSYKEARDMLELERRDKENMRTEKDQMQASIDSLRQEISKLIEELGNENKAKEHLSIQKKSYKAKLSLANQRLKHFCSSLDQMALLIYQRVA